MNLLTDRVRSFSLFLWKSLKIAGAMLEGRQELGVTSSQDFRDLNSEWFGRRRHVLGIL